MTPPYKPLPPDRLYLGEDEWKERLDAAALARLTPFAVPEARDVIDIGARAGHNFVAERAEPERQCVRGGEQARARRCRPPASAS